jgi:pimeloyl-ACP methyl ester carboxylesterase
MNEVQRPHTRSARLGIFAILSALITLSVGVISANAQSSGSSSGPKPTVVLVHGAFADSSGWNDVIVKLQRKGYNVIAPANPLRSVSGDSQYLKEFLATVEGLIVLVGHSYGGFVMTNAATGNPNVKALVYIASFAPDAGETVASISASAPGSLLGPAALTIRAFTRADGEPGAEGYITPTMYRDVFAADLPKTQAWGFAVAQRPADLSILTEPSGEPAWKNIPTWTLVAKQDRVIPPGAQEAMASRANATTMRLDASHSVAVSQPTKVADFIVRAARSVD